MIRSLSIRRAGACSQRLASGARQSFKGRQQKCHYSSFPEHSDELDLPPITAAHRQGATFVPLSSTAEDRRRQEENDTRFVVGGIRSLDATWEETENSMDSLDEELSTTINDSGQLAPQDDGGTQLRALTFSIVNEVEFGKFTKDHWHEARQLLDHWCRVNPLASSPESVDQSFHLLDRMVLEQEAQNFNENSRYYLYTRVLRDVVRNWNRCVRNFHSFSVEDQALLRYEYTPMELLARLENYSERSPGLQFDTKILNMIIDGAGRCCMAGPAGVPNMISPRVATSFAQSLFDRMNMEMPSHTTEDEEEDEEEDEDEEVAMGQTDDEGALPPLGPQQQILPNDSLGSKTTPDVLTYSSLIYLFAQHGLAPRAESILNQLYRCYIRSKDENLKPDVEIFTSVLLAWSKSDDPRAAERAEAILRRMQELSAYGVDLEPDLVAYTVVLGCWARVADTHSKKSKKIKPSFAKESIERASQLFQEMSEKGHLSTRAYNIMLNVYAKAGRTKEAEALFRKMIVGYQSGNSAIRPDKISVNTLLGAFSRWGHNNCGDRAIAVMEEYERLYKQGTIDDPPDIVTYNKIIHCLAVAGQPERAEELLHKLKAMQQVGGTTSIMPDKITWNTVIDGYARAKNPRRAEELLEMMYQEYLALDGKNSHMKPDIKTFCTVLNAWRSSGEAGSGDRADAILKTMHGLSNSGILNVEPNTIAYNIVLACWAKSHDREAPRRAEQVLDTMEDLFHKGSSTVRPDGLAYWSVLSAYANRDQARHAERILERHHQQSLPAAMGGGGNTQEPPNAVSYNKVLAAFKRSTRHDSAQGAEELWKRWQKRFENGQLSFPTTPQSVQVVLEAWEAAARRQFLPYDKAAIRAKKFLHYVTENYEGEGFPDTAAHNIVLRIFGLPSCLDSAAAKDYFWFMAHKGNKHEKPNLESLKLVLSAIKASRAENSAEQVESLIRKVTELDIQPDLECYRILLNCLEDARTLQSAKKADSILQQMEENPNLTPDGQDHIQVVRLWTKVNNSEAVFNADTNFRLMKRRYYGGDESMKPTANAFLTVIKSWERSDHANKAESIQGLKAEMVFLFGEKALEPHRKEKKGK